MPLTRRQRKAELILKGVTMSQIARDLDVTPQQVAEVVAGRRRSQRVEDAVAAAIGRPVDTVFPPRQTTATAA